MRLFECTFNNSEIGAVIAVLGSTNRLETAIKILSREVLKQSIYADGKRTFVDAIRFIMKDYDVSHYGDKIVPSIGLPLKEIGPEHLMNLKANELSAYIGYHLSINNDFKRGLIKGSFPDFNFDINSFHKAQQSTQYDNKKSLALGTSMNQLIKFYLSSVPLFKDAAMKYQQFKGSFVDTDKAMSILYEAGYKYSLMNKTGDSIKDFKSALESVKTKHMSYHNDNVNSILMRLFEMPGTKAQVGSLFLPSLQRVSNSKNYKQWERQDATDLLTGIISFFGSSENNNLIDVKIGNKIDTVDNKGMKNFDSIVDNIKRTIQRSVYNLDDMSIKESIKEMYTKAFNEEAIYSFESDGIKINGRYFIKKIKNFRGDDVFDFVDSSIDKKDLINSLIMTGLTSLKGKILSSMLITNKNESISDSIEDNDEWYDYYDLSQKELLATAIATNMYTIKTGIDQEEAVKKLKEEKPKAKQLDYDKVLGNSFTHKNELKSEMDKLNMKYETAEDGHLIATNVDSLYYIRNDEDKKENIEIKAVKPTDFYKMIKVLGQIAYQEENARSENMLYVAGKKIWTVEKRNHILSMFNMEGNFDNDRSKLIKKISNDESKSNSEDVIIEMKNGRKTNSFFDTSASVNRVSLLPGLSNDYRSSDTFTRQDEFNTHMAIFFDSFKKTQAKGRSTFTIPLGYNERKYSVNVSFNYGFVKFKFKNNGKIKDVEFDNERYIEQIKKIFNYYHSSAVASHNRWTNFIANSYSDIFQNDEFKKHFSKSAEETNFSENKKVQFKITEEEINELKSSNLKNQLDYYISENSEGEKVIGFGNALRFSVYNTNAISYENYLKIKEYNSFSEERNFINEETGMSPNEEFLNDIFGVDMRNDFLRNKNYLFNSEERWGINEFYENKDNPSIFTNPVLRAQYLTMFLTNSMLTQVVYGNPQGAKSDSDYFKRNNPTKTGKTTPVFGTRKGLNKVGKAIVVSSKTDMRTDEALKGNVIESFDGQSMGFMFHYIALMNSLGGKEYSQFNRTMIKPLTAGANAATGIQTQLKQAVDYYSGREISKHRKLFNMQMNLVRIWNRDVQRGIIKHNAEDAFNKYQIIDTPINLVSMMNQYLDANDQDFEKAAIEMWDNLTDDSKNGFDAIKHKNLIKVIKDNLPMGFTDETVVKTGLSNVNNIDPTMPIEDVETVSSVLHDNEKYGIVNNPFQAIDENSTVAIPNQEISHMKMGSHNLKNANKIAKALTNIQQISEEKLFEEIGVNKDVDSWEQNDIEKFKNFLRNKGRDVLMNMRTGNAVLDMIENGASIDIPIVAETLKSIFRKMRNDRTLKPRFKGYRANQSSGAHHELFETSDGSIFTYESAMKKFSNFEEMIGDGSLKVRGLNYMHLDGDKHINSEVVAPYMYRRMFNIKENEDVSDVYTMETADGSVPLMGIIRNIIEEYGERSITKLTSAIYKALENTYLNDNAVLRNIYRGNPHYNESVGEGIKITKELAGKMAKYFIKFDKSLEVTVNRVPFDSPSLGFIARIVSFTEGNGNTIYINPLENVRTGADQDIDQLSVYFNNFNDDGFIKDESTVEENQNAILESIKEFYKNPKNSKVIYGTTGTKVLQQVVNEIKKKDSSIRRRNITPMNSLSSIIKLNDLYQDAYNTLKTLTLNSSAYAEMLSSMSSKYVGKRIFLTNRRKSTYEEMAARTNTLSSFLQAALDNQKVMILGDMNIPQKASGLVIALSAFGMNEQQIGDFFTSDAMSYILYKIRESSNIDEKSVYIPALVKGQLNYFAEQKIETEKLINELYGNVSRKEIEAKRDQNQRDIYYARELIKEGKSDSNKLHKEQLKLESINEKIDFVLNYSENVAALNLVYEASVYGEAMRRFGQIIALRNGMRTKTSDSIIHKRQLELSIGQDLINYIDSEEDITEEQFINYYKNHSNNYRKSENKEGLEKIERDVFNSLQLGNFIKSNPYYINNLRMINSDSKMWGKTFFADNEVFDDLEKEVMELQNRFYAEYPNQLFDIHQIATEIMLDVYLKQKTAEGMSFNLSIPDHNTLKGTNDIYNDTKLGTREDRKLFMLRFPYVVNNIKTFLLNANTDNDIIGFMENFDFEEEIDPDVFKDNKFFDLINIDGYEGFARIFALEGNDSNNAKKLEIYNDFMKLPKELRTMFQIYSALQNKLQYKSKGIDPFMGTDLMLDISKTVDFNSLPSKLNIDTAIDHVGTRNSIKRYFKAEDPATYTYKTIKTKNNIIRKAARFRGTMEGTNPDLDVMTFVVPNAIYDTAAKTMWYPNLQQIKLDHTQEAKLRNPILNNPSAKRHFLTGSSFTAGIGLTGTGMIASIHPNTYGTEVTVWKYDGDINKIIEKREAAASEKLAILKLGNEGLRNNLINGKQRSFFIRNADFQKGIFTGFRSDSVIGSIFNVKGTSTDIQNTATLEITYVGKFNKEQLIEYAKNSDRRLKTEEAIDNWIFNEFGIESYDDIYKKNVIAHFYTSKVLLTQY